MPDEMCAAVATAGGIGAVIAAMLNCPDVEDVQFYGGWALLNIVSGAHSLRTFARQEGVVEVAEAALACFPEHAGIQEKCKLVLEIVRSV
ncbi:hypothetical protein PINS_up019337 [Pythium insidiosum]|nr:hypothetical protein PINS_up019337 [Pythium insidiosum]